MPATNLFKSCLVILLFATPLAINAAEHWEYVVKTYSLVGDDKALTQRFNKLGEQQWELVNCTEGNAKITCIFKRLDNDG